MKNKKGALGDLASNFRVIVAIFIILIMIGVVAIVILLMSSAWYNALGTLTDTLTSIPSTSNATNISYAASVTFGNYNQAFQQVKWISFAILLGMILGTIVVGIAAKTHPFLFPTYVILVVVAIFFSIYLSNTYENILNTGNSLTTTLNTFTGANWIIINLPFIISVVGTLGTIFTFIRMSQGEGGSLI